MEGEREREREIGNEKFNLVHYTSELVYIQGAITTKQREWTVGTSNLLLEF